MASAGATALKLSLSRDELANAIIPESCSSGLAPRPGSLSDAPVSETLNNGFTSVAANPRGRVRLRTLVLTRWVAVAGQATALLVVHFILGFELPIVAAMIAVGASALVNLWAELRRPPTARLDDREARLYLGFDLLQLGVLLYLTGGLNNPFAILVLAPVTVSATILSRRSTIALSVLAVGIVVILAFFHLPLPWPDANFDLDPLFILGFAMALALSAVFIALYVFSVAEEARRRTDALSATQLALAREQRVSALGTLAAAAAHGLGSPLGTIAVIAKEIARDLPPDSPLREDVDLLLSQSNRCREILAGLAARPEETGGDPFALLPLPALVEAAAAPHRTGRVRLLIDDAANGDEMSASGAVPIVARSPEILHGLGNLIENAFEFAASEVRVVIRWDERYITIMVLDDGPGYDPGLIDRLGEPYLSGGTQDRDGNAIHMGLGVFIAQTLLERTGASLRFRNRVGGGAEVKVSWRREALEAEPTGDLE